MSWLKRLFEAKSQSDAPKNASVTASSKSLSALLAGGGSAGAFLEHAAQLPSAQLAALTKQVLDRHKDTIRPLLEFVFITEGGPKVSKEARSLANTLIESIWEKDPDGFTVLTRDAELSIRSAAVGAMSVALIISKPSEWLEGPELQRAQASYKEILGRVLAGLTGALQDEDSEVRASALRGLGAAGESAPLALMLPLAHDPDPQIRVSWLLAFYKTQEPAVLERVVALASDPVAKVRASAPMALSGHLGQVAAVGAMRSLAHDAEASVRIAVAEWVKYSKAKVAGEILEVLSADADPTVRKAAVEALAKSYNDDFKLIFQTIAARFWESDETADAHRAAGGTLIPHDAHAGVARLRRPRRDTAAIEVSGTFSCIGGCNGRVPFTVTVSDSPVQQQQVKCSCGLTNSLDVSEQAGFIWVITRPLGRSRPLNPNMVRMGIAIRSVRTGEVALGSLGLRDEEQKLWIGDPRELLLLRPQDAAATGTTQSPAPTKEVLVAKAMKHYDQGLRNLSKSQGNKSAMWFGEASRDFTSAIGVDPSMVEAYRRRATCFTALGEAAKAKADLDHVKLLESASSYIAPSDHAAAQALCGQARQIMESGGLISDALFQLNKAIDADPTYADAYDARSDVYMAVGMADEAVADIQCAGRLK